MNNGGSFLVEPVLGDVFCREMFSDEQREIDRTVRKFAAERIFPHREELGQLNRELSLQLMREVAQLGLTAVDVPENYGGLELDKVTSALVAEAVATGGSASWAVTFSVHVGIGTLPIVFFGNESQKERYLPKLASAEHLAAYALTEPETGSDALNLKTTAELTEDGEAYLLNGTKHFISNGGWADTYIVFAKLAGKDVTAFIVERNSPGLTVGNEEKKLGIKGSSTVSLFLEEVRVPKENLLGKPGQGGSIALNVLNVGRYKLGVANLGGCKSVITWAADYALERRQFGQPIAFFDAVRSKFADMIVRTYALDSVVYRTVGLMDDRFAALDSSDPGYDEKVMDALEEYAIEAAICKILGSETTARVADHGVQIYGGNGFSEEYPMARVYRDCRIERIYEGTNEMNRMVIYAMYLKKALMEELPLREAVTSRGQVVGGGGGALDWEVRTLDTARRLVVKCLFEAISLYGQDLRNEEVVGEDLADLVTAYYSASSAVRRLARLGDAALRDRALRALARLVTGSCLEEVWRLCYRLRPVLAARSNGSEIAQSMDTVMQDLHLPFDPVKEVRVLTDDLFHHGRYRFE